MFCIQCIHYLLDCARDTVNVPDDDGWTSLMYVVKTGRADVVRSLLDSGADVNIQEVQTTNQMEGDLLHAYSCNMSRQTILLF